MISVHAKIGLNAKCTNGSYNFLISWMPFCNTRLTAPLYVKPTRLGNGMFKSSNSQVRSVPFLPSFHHSDNMTFLMFPERGLHAFAHLSSTSFASVTLILHGYLGASPEQPQLAISIQLLAYYRQLRRVHPRISFDAFAKSLNHFHSVSLSV
jgi:KDZ transposase family protein